MNHPEQPETAIATIDLAERLESAKAGLFGAATGGLALGAAAMVESWLEGWLLPSRSASVTSSLIHTDTAGLLISGSIAALSGFLFGVTYRYIIRQDRNLHLRSGAVLAFGLVRGLALIEGRLHEPEALLPLAVLGVESLLLFASVRFVLDQALTTGWLKPFGFRPVVVTTPQVERQASSLYSTKSSNAN